MKLSISIILLSLILCTNACTLQPKKPTVIIGSGTQYAAWQNAVLKECNNKAAMITLQIVDEKIKEGYVFEESDVRAIHRYLVEKCSLNAGIVI